MERVVRDEHSGFSSAAIALKNKLNVVWQQLKSHRHKSKPMPFEAELCLLICSMFPGKLGIPFDDLVMDKMGLNLLHDEHDEIGLVREEVRHLINIINDLKYPRKVIGDRITLNYENDGPCNQYVVRMTSGALELADSIASNFPIVFCREAIVEKWPESNRFESCFGLSLVLRKVRRQLVYVKCPLLSLLQLQYKEDSLIPDDFFVGMVELRVLSLDAPSLLQSLNVLRNLISLRLKVLNLEDLSLIGGLTKLKFLSISTSSLIDIPREMGLLENLRLLDLRSTNIAYIAPGVFSRMMKLEELYLPLRFNRWGFKASGHVEWESGEEDSYDKESRINVSLGEIHDRERINANLSEVVFLSLSALHISIPNSSVLPKNSPVFRNIQDFKIFVPSNFKHQAFGKYSSNELQLKGDAFEIEESGICDLMSRAEDLSLTRVRNLKEGINQLKDISFPVLKKMLISECGELEYVAVLPKDGFLFPKLECLHLSMLPSLTEICHYRMANVQCFLNLRQISIRFCHKLKYVFPLSMVRGSALKSLDILDCNELEGIFFEDKKDSNIPLTISSIEKLDLHSLPMLISLMVPENNKVDAFHYDTDGHLATNKVFTIKKKDVTSHMKTYTAFASKLAGNWSQNLKRLKIAFCDVVQVVFLMEESQATSKAFVSLEMLELHGLRNLIHIWFQFPPKLTDFNNLQLLALSECSNSYLFSSRVAKNLVQLQKIYISRCEKMEEIIAEDDENEREYRIVFPRLKLMELQHIPNLKIFSRGTYEIELPLLESLKFNQCNKLKSFSYGLLRTPMLKCVEVNGSSYAVLRDLNATIMRVMNPNNQIFNFVDLKTATKEFSSDNLLGGKGFGKVYLGWMNTNSYSSSKTNKTPVSIKRMDSKQGFLEWQSEVDVLGKQSHPNLVKLLGYCWQDKELFLVYEYVEKGSLANHLHMTNRGGVEPLSWDTRIKIAIGAARGLNFLHTCENKFIHGNVKSSNILLDGDYDAKITDFGYSRTTMNGNAKKRFAPETTVKGPARVIDPEYYRTGRVNVKSDVYSFGAVLLQLMTGSWEFDSCYGHEFMFENWRQILSQERELKSIMDPMINAQYSYETMLRMGQLASKCTEYDHRRRPTMAQVLEELLQIDAINQKDTCAFPPLVQG